MLGTLAAIGIRNMNEVSPRRLVMNVTYLPIINPEIVTGVSLMLLFVFVQVRGFGHPAGLSASRTLILAHITFNVPYVILNVMPKLRQMDTYRLRGGAGPRVQPACRHSSRWSSRRSCRASSRAS